MPGLRASHPVKGEGGQQRVPAVDGALGLEHVVIEVSGQGGLSDSVCGDPVCRQPETRRVLAITPMRVAFFSAVL